MDGLRIISRPPLTVFQFKGIRIEVDNFKILDLPNRLNGKYFIGDATVKNAVINIGGELKQASILDHFVIEEAMKDLDDRSYGQSTLHPLWQ